MTPPEEEPPAPEFSEQPLEEKNVNVVLKESRAELAEMDEIVKELQKLSEETQKHIAHPIALIHHSDFFTISKKINKHLDKIDKDLNKLQRSKKNSPEERAKELVEIAEEFAEIDEGEAMEVFSSIFMARAVAKYFEMRYKLAHHLKNLAAEVQQELPEPSKELQEIQELETQVAERIPPVVRDLVNATHRIAPEGPLVKALKELADLLKAEGVKNALNSWIMRRYMKKELKT